MSQTTNRHQLVAANRLRRPVRGIAEVGNDMRVGEVISAEVVRIEFNHVVVNAGLKSESYVAHRGIQERPGRARSPGRRLRLGRDRRRRERLRRHHPQSRDKAKRLASWMSLENALESGEFVTGTVSGKVKGGLTVLVNGIRAFLPGSAARHAPGQGHEPVRGQDDGVQGHQARPQAQQRRVVAPRGRRGFDGRRTRQAAGDADRRRHRATAWSRTSPSTVRSSTSAASTACCTSPTWPGAVSVTPAKWSPSARN